MPSSQITGGVMAEDGQFDAEAAPLAAHPAAMADSLRQAMRRARQDNAERAGVLADLRAARIGRLELLQDALQPLVAQIPADIDIFDMALLPGDNPRLFIDMIGFVEMGRDARLYRLLQDSRHGRVALAESDHLGTIVDAITDYVARRLLERDKALAGDIGNGAMPAPAPIRLPACFANPPKTSASETEAHDGRVAPAIAQRPIVLTWFRLAFALAVDVLGAIAFLAILVWVGWYAWLHLNAPS